MNIYSSSENLWEYVLPEGASFCHWGGRDISRKVLGNLDIRRGDRLCDLCCGEAGTLSFIDEEDIEVYGVDISGASLKKALNRFEGRNNFYFVQYDVRNMSFVDGFFDKAFAQDPDVFLCPNKDRAMGEISRVIKRGGVFALQTYCATSYLKQSEKQRMLATLRNIGYRYTEVITLDEINMLLRTSKFLIKNTEDLHEVYKQDNLRMIEKLEANWSEMLKININQANKMRELLYLERELFLRKAWTGILQIAEKQ